MPLPIRRLLVLGASPCLAGPPRISDDPAVHRVYVVAEAGDHAEILVYPAIQ